ncbi:hypothetical protein HK44_026865 [Pseudomonas fluorescens HK44]|uniref:Uncharacterized protein n=1 Tax=Pseudomonas fluorescens HK44 TaxID=1042209 RepID=A0A010TDS9_PSEFL|nr:hypothetical protein HK44_026865 [Pseudomonas fluorescens HK44]
MSAKDDIRCLRFYVGVNKALRFLIKKRVVQVMIKVCVSAFDSNVGDVRAVTLNMNLVRTVLKF